MRLNPVFNPANVSPSRMTGLRFAGDSEDIAPSAGLSETGDTVSFQVPGNTQILKNNLEPKQDFPTQPDWKVDAVALGRSLLGGHFLSSRLQKEAFDPKTSQMEYEAAPRKALSAFGEIPQTFSLASAFTGSHIPVAYLPPIGNKPVLILSPGAKALVTEYQPFMAEMRKAGFGILTYQYAFFNGQGQFINQQHLPFSAIETKITNDLNQLSELLASGIPVKPAAQNLLAEASGSVPSPLLKIPYNQQILVGHSTGGIVSSNVAAAHQDHDYAGLILLAAPTSFQQSFLNTMARKTHEAVYRIIPKQRVSSLFQNALDLSRSLGDVKKVPTLYVQGQDDSLVRQDVYKQVMSKIPPFDAMTFICLPNARHRNLLNQDSDGNHGQETAKIVQKFIADSFV